MSFQDLTPLINTVGLVVLAAAIWFAQWRSGGKQVSAEVIANYAALDSQQKDQIAAYQEDIEEIKAAMRASEKAFIERIAKLEGALGEKDSQLKMLHEILANRNPELEKVLKEIRDFMAQLTLKNDKQTQMLENAVQSTH